MKIVPITCIFMLIVISIDAAAIDVNHSKVSNDTGMIASNGVLLDDALWFFQQLVYVAATIEDMLPNVTDVEQNGSYSQSTRLALLSGVRHLIVGVKEISQTFQQSFETDQVRQLQHLSEHISNFVQNIVESLGNWLRNLRIFVEESFKLFSFYMPEVLLGKCIGRYLQRNYPESALYDYPKILFEEIYRYVLNLTTDEGKERTETNLIDTATDALDKGPLYGYDDIKDNEIPHTDDNKLSLMNTEQYVADDPDSTFGGNTVQDESDSWKRCGQIYLADAVMRKMKLFFLQ